MTFNQLYVILGSTHLFLVWIFLISYKKNRNKNIPPYMKGFYFYPLVGLIMILFFWLDYIKISPNNLFQTINTLSLIFHYYFLASFICKVLKLQGIFDFERILFWIFLSIIICSEVYDFLNKTRISFIVTNTFLLFFCICYYNKLFKNISVINLTDEPSFWVITGVFLGMGITLPFYIFNQYLFNLISRDNYYLLALMGISGYMIMHLFFIKAFLCKTMQFKKS